MTDLLRVSHLSCCSDVFSCIPIKAVKPKKNSALYDPYISGACARMFFTFTCTYLFQDVSYSRFLIPSRNRLLHRANSDTVTFTTEGASHVGGESSIHCCKTVGVVVLTVPHRGVSVLRVAPSAFVAVFAGVCISLPQ